MSIDFLDLVAHAMTMIGICSGKSSRRADETV